MVLVIPRGVRAAAARPSTAFAVMPCRRVAGTTIRRTLPAGYRMDASCILMAETPEPVMHAYFWIKTAHVVFVMAWMGGVFYLPRILVNLAEAGDEPAVRARLVLMGRRLYRFGHIMFGLAFVFGLLMWQGYRLFGDGLPQMFAVGGWLHAKLALVAVMLAYYIVSGRWLKGVEQGRALPSSRTLRWFNEVPVLVLVAIVYLVLAKPF
jgi:putative membrane protein